MSEGLRESVQRVGRNVKCLLVIGRAIAEVSYENPSWRVMSKLREVLNLAYDDVYGAVNHLESEVNVLLEKLPREE